MILASASANQWVFDKVLFLYIITFSGDKIVLLVATNLVYDRRKNVVNTSNQSYKKSPDLTFTVCYSNCRSHVTLISIISYDYYTLKSTSHSSIEMIYMYTCYSSLQKLMGQINLTWVIWVAIASSHMSQRAGKKSITIDPFTHLYCCRIMTVFIVLISNHNTAFYTWHELKSRVIWSWVACMHFLLR